MSSTSDFVKKLYKMLEDPNFQHVVSWGVGGDCFVVKDMNEFTKSILPRMFKHSNFASFVRQLNKYDFHKVKNADDNQFGEHSWTFRHPDFHADRRDALENIKRKVPAARKNSTRNVNSPAPPAVANPPAEYVRTLESLQGQVDHLTRSHDEVVTRLRSVEANYQNVLNELVNFQRNMAQQDGVMQNLIQYFLNIENGKIKAEALVAARNGTNSDPSFGESTSADSESNPFVPAQEAQRMIGGFTENDVARASLIQMNEIARRAELAGMSFDLGGTSSNATGPASINPANAGLSGVTGVTSMSGSSGATNTAGGVLQQTQQQSQQSLQPPEAPLRPSSAVQRLMAATADLMNGDNEPSNGSNPAQPGTTEGPQRPLSRQDALARIGELQRTRPDAQMRIPLPGPSTAFGPADAFVLGPEEGTVPNLQAEPFHTTDLTHEGLQVFTLGHLMPRSAMDDENGNWTFDPESVADAVVLPTPRTADGGIGQSSEGTVQNVPSSERQKLRIRRSTYVPGWSVPPRVLLVEDDAVSRKLSSKFLQIFGCTIDVAVDGVGAVNKMNLEKYDLVLMDIVMPKLDGVSATSMIRQFDHMTPIISMTSNSKPAEIMNYYASGMNDILPKPFTKEGLFDMLDKHLMHLKAIQQQQLNSKIARSIGIPPMSDPSFENAMTIQAQAQASADLNQALGMSMDDDGKINPFAGMGLTDEQYNHILQRIVGGESFTEITAGGVSGTVLGMSGASVMGKRGLGEVVDPVDDRNKRGRFEVVE